TSEPRVMFRGSLQSRTPASHGGVAVALFHISLQLQDVVKLCRSEATPLSEQ
ncbi:hypothetical protein A2U01_0072242, partial [Trifolium medium]|nr:hypothetical protein [Trifolium medium]